MEDIIYITPNGTEVDEATLRNKYGDRFDQFVSEGLLKKKDLTQDTVSQSQVGTSALPEPEFSQEEDGFFERTFGKSGITDLIDDTVVNIRQGIAQGASLNEALKLQRKGSRATKQDIQQYADAVGRMQSIPVTDEMMDFQKIYEENDKSWLGFIKGISKNPSVLSGVIAQSMASMINPTVAFGAVKGAGAGALTGFAAGAATGPGAAVTALTGAKLGAIAGLTNTLEGGLAFTEFLQEEIEKKGLEFNDDSIAAILNDDEAFRKVKSRTKARGYSIALVNTITAGVASQLARSGRNIKRLGDLKVGGVTVPTSRVLPGPQTAIRSGTEFVGGGLGEVAGRAAAGQEMDVAEIGFEAFGELGAPETIIPSFRNATYEIDGERVTRNDVIDIINGQPDIKEDNTKYLKTLNNITIKNDSALENEKNALYKEATTKNEVLKGLTDNQKNNITDEQLTELVKLNIDYKEKKSSNTPEGNRNAQKIDEQIQTITNAIQKPSTETIPVPKQPKTSPAVGTGDTQGAVPAGETPSEQIETTTQPAEEVETQVEAQESEVIRPKDIDIVSHVGFTTKALDEGKLVLPSESKTPKASVSDTRDAIFFSELPNWEEKFGRNLVSFKANFDKNKLKNKIQEGKNKDEKEFLATSNIPLSKNEGLVSIELYPGVDFNNFLVGGVGQDLAEFLPGGFNFENDKKATQILVDTEYLNALPSALKNAQKLAEKYDVPILIKPPVGVNGEQFIINPASKETVQVTQEEVVEETYTLPENPKERVADFEILDNRKGQEDFEIDEEGNGKWIIRNIKTGIILPLKRKSDAQAELQKIKINKETFDYGEGEVILEEFQAKEKQTPPPAPEKEKIKKEAPKKVKQTVPDKPTEPAPAPPLQDEVQEAVNNISPGFDRITKAKIVDNLDNFASKAKTLLREKSKRNVKLEKLRSTPGPYFDQALGINNSTAVYDNTTGEVAREFAVYEGVFEKITTQVRDSQNKIAFSDKSKRAKKFGIERARNAQLTDALLIGLYMDVRQAELNKLPNGEFRDTSPDPVAMLNISIQNNPAPEARTLQKFKDKYVKDGQIKSEDILKDMTPTQKSVLKDLDKLNTELEPLVKEIYERQGRDFEPIKGYFHRLVIPDSNDADKVDVLKNAKNYGDRDLRADTTIERVEGVKPINYNPFISVLRAYQQTLLDYYVSPAADKAQDITAAVKEKYKNGNEGQQKAAIALDLALKNNLETLYVNSYMGANNLNIRKQIEGEINKNMYRAMLSSGPRFAAELLGNFAMFVTQSPKIVKDAYSKYRDLTTNKKNANKYKDVLIKLKSSEGRKVGKRRSATNKMIDVNDYLNLGQTEKAMIDNPVFQKMEIISQYGPKQYYEKVMNVADDLMSGADKVVTRPMWASKFANEFIDNVKKYNNEDIDITLKDFDKIADGTSKYLKSEYKKARDEAVRKADRMVVSFVTSGNPVNAIIKNRPTRKNEGFMGVMDYYRMVNSYMANFNLNEYAQARFAVGAMLKSGYMTKREAGATLAALLARMSSYVILYRLMGDWMDALLGAPEKEEEDPLEQQIARQLVGSVATLLFRGGLGNIPSLPINFGIELLNEKYLESLRDGKPYDSYDNSIVFSLVTLDTLENRSLEQILISIASGRYGPAVKSLLRAGDLGLRATGVTRKSEEAQARAAEELLDRMFLQEFIGLLGYMPFYKDIRRQSLKKRFDEGAGGMSASELKKQNKALYDLIYED